MTRRTTPPLTVEPLERRDAPTIVPLGGEFGVNTYTTDNQNLGGVGMDAAGDFVITWQSTGQDGDSYGVYAQRYSATGLPLGAEFQVNTFTTNRQSGPAVAMDAGGDFV